MRSLYFPIFRRIFLVLGALFFFSCSSSPKKFQSSGDPEYKAEVRRVMLEKEQAIGQCAYKVATKKHPTVSGKVTMHFTIENTGGVSKVAVKENTLKSKAVGKCLSETIRGITFPTFEDSLSVNITYPFVFKTPS